MDIKPCNILIIQDFTLNFKELLKIDQIIFHINYNIEMDN